MPLYTLIVDTHIHLYRKFDISLLFSSAVRNMGLYTTVNNISGTVLPILGLTSTLSEMSWNDLCQITSEGGSITGAGGQWKLRKTEDDTLLRATNTEGHDLYLLCGHQLVTYEKLELLVLGTNSPVYDSAKGLIWHIEQNTSGILITPWAVGKWLGRRGEIISEVVERFAESVKLGDNSGRPALWFYIKQFKQASECPMDIWPGTDPLPLTGQEQAVGMNTIAIRDTNLASLSGKEVVAALKSKDAPVLLQSRRESLVSFFRNQISLRLQVE